MVYVWNLKFGNYCLQFCVLETGMHATEDRIMYAFPLELHQEDADRKNPPMSGDIEVSEIIKGCCQTQ